MEWFCTFNKAFLKPEFAKIGLEGLEKVAKLEGIPKNTTWRASVRGFGIIVFGVWGKNDKS